MGSARPQRGALYSGWLKPPRTSLVPSSIEKKSLRRATLILKYKPTTGFSPCCRLGRDTEVSAVVPSDFKPVSFLWLWNLLTHPPPSKYHMFFFFFWCSKLGLQSELCCSTLLYNDKYTFSKKDNYVIQVSENGRWCFMRKHINATLQNPEHKQDTRFRVNAQYESPVTCYWVHLFCHLSDIRHHNPIFKCWPVI